MHVYALIFLKQGDNLTNWTNLRNRHFEQVQS